MGVIPTAKATVAADTKSATRLVVIEIPPARDGPDCRTLWLNYACNSALLLKFRLCEHWFRKKICINRKLPSANDLGF